MFVSLKRKILIKPKKNENFFIFASSSWQSCHSFNRFYKIIRLAAKAACLLTGLFLFRNFKYRIICQVCYSNGRWTLLFQICKKMEKLQSDTETLRKTQSVSTKLPNSILTIWKSSGNGYSNRFTLIATGKREWLNQFCPLNALMCYLEAARHSLSQNRTQGEGPGISIRPKSRLNDLYGCNIFLDQPSPMIRGSVLLD